MFTAELALMEISKRISKKDTGKIPETLLNDFRALIQKKYGYYRKGFLSYEIEQAIQHWIAMRTEAQSEIRVSNPEPMVNLVFSKVDLVEILISAFF